MPAKDAIVLEFDQPVVWKDSLVSEFLLDGEKGKVASGVVSGNQLTLKLKEPMQAAKITYLDEKAWSQDRLLVGKNGIAALHVLQCTDFGRKETEMKTSVALCILTILTTSAAAGAEPAATGSHGSLWDYHQTHP